jgi:hypothetical protein
MTVRQTSDGKRGKRGEQWGPLATPIHHDVVPIDDDGTPWRDYALFCWWAPDSDVYVMTHHMSSPDPSFPGRTRVSAWAGGTSFELIEIPDRGTYRSKHISVELAGRLVVDHPELRLDATLDPMYQPIDFHALKGLPSNRADRPLHHYQQPQRATGTVTVRGERRDFDGVGLRDRTWGYRNESSQWEEYQYLMADVGDQFLVFWKLKGISGPQIDLALLLADDGQQQLEHFMFARNGSGLLNDVEVRLPTGTVSIQIAERPVGFWVPQGGRQTGPTFSAYDEFVRLTLGDGRRGSGLATYGILRKLV